MRSQLVRHAVDDLPIRAQAKPDEIQILCRHGGHGLAVPARSSRRTTAIFVSKSTQPSSAAIVSRSAWRSLARFLNTRAKRSSPLLVSRR